MTAAPTGLSAERISVSLSGQPILSEVSVEFARGGVTAIVGPNGAGKSTLLACLAGLRRPDGGAVTLDGAAILTLRPRERARRLAFLEQTPQVAWAIDVRTLVGLGRTPFTGARGLGVNDHSAVEAALIRTGTTAFADRPVNTLSGGERARALIARALAGEPDWLLADEPLTGLDIGHQLDTLALLRALAADGRGVVLTLHDLALAARIAARVIVLHEGRIAADGPPSEVLTAALLARVYGVEAVVAPGPGGLAIDLVGRL